MSAYSNGAYGAPVRRAHTPGQLPFAVDVLGVPYRLRLLPAAPGGEVSAVAELSLPDGTRHLAGRTLGCNHCDCDVYLDSGDRAECHHLNALVREGVLSPPETGWPAWTDDPAAIRAECTGAKGGHR